MSMSLKPSIRPYGGHMAPTRVTEHLLLGIQNA